MKNDTLKELGLTTWAKWSAAVKKPQQQAAPLPVAPPVADDAEASKRIELLGLVQMAEAVSKCQSCPLHKSRNNAVFGRGTQTQGKIVVVGEGPGEKEDLEGLPFVGPAGKLLNNIIKALGMEPDKDIYITNIVKCRPPNNRNPNPEEIEACMPYLRRQLELLAPKLIITAGRVAANALIKQDATMASLRGQIHRIGDVPAVAIYHPAYLLRKLTEKRKMLDDLQLIHRALELD